MVETEKLVMMSTSCYRSTKQASGQSLQMLADITIPSLFGRRSLHDQLTFSNLHFASLGLPPSSDAQTR